MPEDDPVERLLAGARQSIHPLVVSVRRGNASVVVDLLRGDGTIVCPGYSTGPDELLAVLAAEQRYLVEEVGAGSLRGATYLDKARERVRRALEGPGAD